MRRWIGAVWVTLVVVACGEDKSPFDVDPAVERFVGTWDAVEFTVTGDAPPNTVVDVLTLGDFWIAVEPSGRYQAVIEFGGGITEFGQLSVQSESVLILDSDTDPPAPSNYSFATADSLILDGATDFDFNLDGTTEPGQAHIEIVRR
jgi:hypothetical protein